MSYISMMCFKISKNTSSDFFSIYFQNSEVKDVSRLLFANIPPNLPRNSKITIHSARISGSANIL